MGNKIDLDADKAMKMMNELIDKLDNSLTKSIDDSLKNVKGGAFLEPIVNVIVDAVMTNLKSASAHAITFADVQIDKIDAEIPKLEQQILHSFEAVMQDSVKHLVDDLDKEFDKMRENLMKNISEEIQDAKEDTHTFFNNVKSNVSAFGGVVRSDMDMMQDHFHNDMKGMISNHPSIKEVGSHIKSDLSSMGHKISNAVKVLFAQHNESGDVPVSGDVGAPSTDV